MGEDPDHTRDPGNTRALAVRQAPREPDPRDKLPSRLLGHMRWTDPAAFEYFELMFLRYLKTILLTKWHLVQGGDDVRTRDLWLEIMWVLELDGKSQTDLFLLCQCGENGRAEANEILWTLLTLDALDPDYKDLSNLVSNRVQRARKNFERPPATHHDRGSWRWEKYLEVRNPHFSPSAVPRRKDQPYLPDRRRHKSNPGGVPIAPPGCWIMDVREW